MHHTTLMAEKLVVYMANSMLNSQTIFTPSRTPSPSAVTGRSFRQLQPPQRGGELPHRHGGGMRRRILIPSWLLERIAAATSSGALSGAVVDLPLGQGGFGPAPFGGGRGGSAAAGGGSSGVTAGGTALGVEIGVRRGVERVGGNGGGREWARRWAGGVAGDLHRRRRVLGIEGSVVESGNESVFKRE